MNPVTIDVTHQLPANIDRVWQVLTDWEHQGDWMREASEFVVVSPHREGVGVEAEATVRIGGISTRDRIRVDTWEPPTHLGIVHLGWVKGRGDLHMTPIGADRTWLEWREELIPPLGPLGTVGMRLFRPLMRRVFERDAHFLAELVGAAPDGRYPETHT